MVMTQAALAMLGGLGTLALVGMFVRFDDDMTQLVIRFVGAVLWGFFGMGSFDVIVRASAFASASEPILPLAYLGIGLSIMMALFAVKTLLSLLRSEAGEADLDGMVR